jgi:hypothetical protein
LPRSTSSPFSLCHHPPPFMFNGLLSDCSSPLIRSSAFGVGLIPPPPYGILVLHKGSQFALLHPLATTTLESFGRRYVLYSSARHPLQTIDAMRNTSSLTYVSSSAPQSQFTGGWISCQKNFKNIHDIHCT